MNITRLIVVITQNLDCNFTLALRKGGMKARKEKEIERFMWETNLFNGIFL